MRSAPRSSAAASTWSTRSMFWRCSTTFRVSGQPSSRTVRAAAILRANDGVPAMRSESVGSSACSEPGVLQLRGPRGGEPEGARDEVGVEPLVAGGGDDLGEVAAQQRFPAREVALQRAELGGLGDDALPVGRGELVAVGGDLDRVRA